MRFLDKTFIVWPWVLAAALFAIGYFGWDAYTGWSFVVWGIFVRMVLRAARDLDGQLGHPHVGLSQLRDDRRQPQLWWVGLLAFGEGWHNNHHAYQRMARHGHRWWEIDVTYWAIWRWKRSAWRGTLCTTCGAARRYVVAH